MKAILNLKPQNNTKELKSLLGAIQFLARFLPKFSEKTNRLRKLLKEMNHGKRKMIKKKILRKIKRMNRTEKPFSGHYAKDKENLVTTDASKTGLEITLWQKQDSGYIKPIAFGNRYLNYSEVI